MSARHLIVALSLALAVPAFADDAQRRGGSGGGSSAGAGHHSGGGSHSGGVSGHPDGGGGSSGVVLTDAQRRHPRAGTGTGYRYGHYYGYPGYYSPYSFGFGYYYPGFWGSAYWGPYYPYGYGYGYSGYGYGGYGYGGYGYAYRDAGSMRILVDPSQTRVYVDGYYAGVADDFDGIFQRLHVSPGRHEIALKLEGYRTHRIKVYVPVDHTVKLHHDMVKGSGEDTVEDLSGGYEEARGADREEPYARDRGDAYARERGEPGPEGVAGEAGTVRLEVQPPDASVYVDGEFRGTARQIHRLELPPGRHLIEVVRPGFRTLEREVEVRPGESTDVDVNLERS